MSSGRLYDLVTHIPHFQLAHQGLTTQPRTPRSLGQRFISINSIYSQLRSNGSCELIASYSLLSKAFRVKCLSVTLKGRKVGCHIPICPNQLLKLFLSDCKRFWKMDGRLHNRTIRCWLLSSYKDYSHLRGWCQNKIPTMRYG